MTSHCQDSFANIIPSGHLRRGKEREEPDQNLGQQPCQDEAKISFLGTGHQKLIEVDDEHKFHIFYKMCTATEVAADALGEEQKGHAVCISGGNDKVLP